MKRSLGWPNLFVECCQRKEGGKKKERKRERLRKKEKEKNRPKVRFFGEGGLHYSEQGSAHPGFTDKYIYIYIYLSKMGSSDR